MIWSISWKNIWRSKVRSLVVITSIMLGIFGSVMLIGIMEGWVAQRTHDAIHKEISHVQIHNPEFLNNEEMKYTIRNYPKVVSAIEKTPGVVAFAPRTKMFAMVRSDWSTTGLVIEGIDPEKEKKVTEISQSITDGNYFTSKEERLPSIVLGDKAAESLRLRNYQVTKEKLSKFDSVTYGVSIKHALSGLEGKRYRIEKDFKDALKKVLPEKDYNKYSRRLINYFSFYRMRSKVTLTLPGISGELAYLTCRVDGIYKTNNTVFDGSTAYVNADAIKKVTGLGKNDFNEIAILCTDNKTAIPVAAHLEKALPENNVMSWKKMSPELALYSDFMKLMDYIYVTIFLLALSFGIINTMLMAVLERTKELGMLMAIGMNKMRVFIMIMLESVFLTLTGGVVGMVVSGFIVHILGKTGIDFSMWAQGYEAIGFASVVHPFVPWDTFVGVTILVILTGILSAIWPARKALRLNPADAIRTE